jgi:8-oxo-dGTP diphosphatase
MDKKGKYIYDWPRPMVTVDAVVFAVSGDTIRLLLIKRKNEPFKNKWAIPGGFIGIDEELGDAVARELVEETGLADVKLEQMHTFGTCGRDPQRQTNHGRLYGNNNRGGRQNKSWRRRRTGPMVRYKPPAS